MSAEIRAFSCTIPASTAIASPVTISLAMPARIVRHIRVRIPPGPLGTVGWSIGLAGVPILPYNPGAWIVGDDEVVEWPVENQPSSGAWQLFGYNLGLISHTLQVQFQVDPPQLVGPGAGLVPLDLTA